MTMSCLRILSKPGCQPLSAWLCVCVFVASAALAPVPVLAQESAAEPATENTPEETPEETPPAENPPTEESPAENPPTEESPAVEPTAEKPTAENPPAETAAVPAEQPEPDKAPEAEKSQANMSAENQTDEKGASDANPVESKPETVADPDWVARGVWTMPPSEGPAAVDFSLVGEYVGELKPTEQAGEQAGEQTDEQTGASDAENTTAMNRLGVQIRALGDGEFEARAYQGGLPGQDGFSNEKPMRLFGRRSGQTLVLSGGPWAMFAGAQQCKIIDVEGNTLAELPRAERESPTLGAAPPEGAMVLFNGTDTSAFSKAVMTDEKLLAQGADINFMLSDFDLHFEFRIPHMPKQREQQRGNSGLYLQSRYECQVLDSFADANVFNGLGALYRFKTPKLNMAFPPLTWQTYDIHFTAARFAADSSKLRNARVTSWINGVMVQDDEELPGPTGAGKPESPTLLPTKIQDHGDPVRFRNIWVIDRGLTGGIEFPPLPKE